MNSGLTVKGVTLKNNVFLAPLAGVTDVGFRCLAKEYGAGLTYTEMVSAKGLWYGNCNTASLLATCENEEVKAVQLFGSDPAVFCEVVRLKALEKFDLIDINMGCPVPKIVKNGEGSALMKNLPLASRVIEACVKNTERPVTVKFRKGFDASSVNAAAFARMCEESGASMITVHGRTREQMYTGRADWDCIADVVSAVRLPVIGNGDIFSAEDARHMLAQTGCAGVMVARGALGRPWIFSEIAGQKPEVDLSRILTKHIEILSRYYPERFVTVHMRKHIAWYVKGLPGAAAIRDEVNVCTNLSELLRLIKSIS